MPDGKRKQGRPRKPVPEVAQVIHQKKNRKPPIKKLTPQNLVELSAANPNLTTRQLGKLMDVDHSAVVHAFKRYGIIRENIEAYKANRADIFAGIQECVAASFTEADIKDASVRDRTILLGTLYDKERLERGLNTSTTLMIYASAVEMANKRPAIEAEVVTAGQETGRFDSRQPENGTETAPPSTPDQGGAPPR